MIPRLNAPYGPPCFLTVLLVSRTTLASPSLNAPYGTPCFLAAKNIKTVEIDGLS